MDNENKHIDITGLLPKYFSNEATKEERKLVDEWTIVDEKNRKDYRDFEKLWNLTASAPEGKDIDLDAEWKILEKSIEPKVITINFTRIIQVAASIILVFILSYIGLRINNTKTERAPVLASSSATLPDGTIISLNAGSKILYKKGFGTHHRILTLKGEAYFEVQKNADLPFVIYANEASITVTGTKFNVKAYKNNPEVKVTVTEGTVKFSETNVPLKETTIYAGEVATFDRDLLVIKKQTLENLNDIAWKTLIMDFDNTVLQEVADILENTYHYKITVDPKVKGCPITVHFENRDLVYILKLLKSTLDLTIETDGKKIFITGEGC